MTYATFKAGETYNVRVKGKVVRTIKCIGTPKPGQAKFEGVRGSKLHNTSKGELKYLDCVRGCLYEEVMANDVA